MKFVEGNTKSLCSNALVTGHMGFPKISPLKICSQSNSIKEDILQEGESKTKQIGELVTHIFEINKLKDTIKSTSKIIKHIIEVIKD